VWFFVKHRRSKTSTKIRRTWVKQLEREKELLLFSLVFQAIRVSSWVWKARGTKWLLFRWFTLRCLCSKYQLLGCVPSPSLFAAASLLNLLLVWKNMRAIWVNFQASWEWSSGKKKKRKNCQKWFNYQLLCLLMLALLIRNQLFFFPFFLLELTFLTAPATCLQHSIFWVKGLTCRNGKSWGNPVFLSYLLISLGRLSNCVKKVGFSYRQK